MILSKPLEIELKIKSETTVDSLICHNQEINRSEINCTLKRITFKYVLTVEIS